MLACDKSNHFKSGEICKTFFYIKRKLKNITAMIIQKQKVIIQKVEI